MKEWKKGGKEEEKESKLNYSYWREICKAHLQGRHCFPKQCGQMLVHRARKNKTCRFQKWARWSGGLWTGWLSEAGGCTSPTGSRKLGYGCWIVMDHLELLLCSSGGSRFLGSENNETFPIGQSFSSSAHLFCPSWTKLLGIRDLTSLLTLPEINVSFMCWSALLHTVFLFE